ncbi:hypothetical protein PR048_020067 [Dryococelus australis]|uniref:Uncharacterized protein n=1 Tax=Dryococelus australis TaxID=614101 RepID=A0ABQ9H5A8_9NEOP|nr:hypothetical protein PR048_020067 [Dryococelus australis]
MLLGRPNISLRGHHDDGGLLQNNSDQPYLVNEGNSRESLRYHIESGKKILRSI